MAAVNGGVWIHGLRHRGFADFSMTKLPALARAGGCAIRSNILYVGSGEGLQRNAAGPGGRRRVYNQSAVRRGIILIARCPADDRYLLSDSSEIPPRFVSSARAPLGRT